MLRPTPLLALVLGASVIAVGAQVSGAADTSPVDAESQPGQERKEARATARQRFADMDANGDGRISAMNGVAAPSRSASTTGIATA